MRSGLRTVPLQSRPNASPFWIMLLLSSTAFGHGMIDADQTRSKKRSFATTFLSSSPFAVRPHSAAAYTQAAGPEPPEAAHAGVMLKTPFRPRRDYR